MGAGISGLKSRSGTKIPTNKKILLNIINTFILLKILFFNLFFITIPRIKREIVIMKENVILNKSEENISLGATVSMIIMPNRLKENSIDVVII